MAKNNGSEIASSINFLSAGTEVKGDIQSNGDFRIDGKLTGSIRSRGKVVIGKSGMIDGEIICQNADVSGNLHGKMVVYELLIVKATAEIEGDIFTGKLAVEPGAKFTGTCNMNDVPKKETVTQTQNTDGGSQQKEKTTK